LKSRHYRTKSFGHASDRLGMRNAIFERNILIVCYFCRILVRLRPWILHRSSLLSKSSCRWAICSISYWGSKCRSLNDVTQRSNRDRDKRAEARTKKAILLHVIYKHNLVRKTTSNVNITPTTFLVTQLFDIASYLISLSW